MILARHNIQRGSLAEDLASARSAGVNLWWLGQAGFILTYRGLRIVIDPYLSDSLALKYKGCEFPHSRMMSSPIIPENLRGIDWVFCTHAHSDHMDPGTLPSLAQFNPDCRFVVPRAVVATALDRGIPSNRLVPIDVGETVDFGDGMNAEALPSAHEDLTRDDNGSFCYLGYGLRLGKITFYHSGDCVPYAGLERRLSQMKVDVALLPVNGRDEYRRSRNVPGNFTLPEAIELCEKASVPVMVAHHWGMFDFNTIAEETLKEASGSASSDLTLIMPSLSERYEFLPNAESGFRKITVGQQP